MDVMLDIPRGEHRNQPGTWWPITAEDGRRSALFTCPGCQQGGSLTWSHAISGDGTVSPSVICTSNGCHFHAHIRLVDWHVVEVPA